VDGGGSQRREETSERDSQAVGRGCERHPERRDRERPPERRSRERPPERAANGTRARLTEPAPTAATTRAMGTGSTSERRGHAGQAAGEQQKNESGQTGAGRGGGGGGPDGGRPAGATSTNAQELKVLYTNAQSIVGKVDELSSVASEMQPDLILVTESWCNE
jgi:hypothetical protein